VNLIHPAPEIFDFATVQALPEYHAGDPDLSARKGNDRGPSIYQRWRTQMTSTTFSTAAVETFEAGLRGELLRPSDGGYDEARTIYNKMIDNRPALIARCAGVADVIQSVQFARECGLLVSVRGGGHNVSGNAICDGGLMIDLSPMKSVQVDPERNTARAEPGVTWGEFDHESQAFGLATTGGLISTTGVAGLTLGGGIGWLMGNHGLACDNLISADVVTADGQLLTASGSENQDLFWGLRGGGGNFGIVTSFEFQLHPVGPMLGGLVIHPLDQAVELMRLYEDFTLTAPNELGTMAVFVTSPEGERVIAIVVCYNGPVEEGERVLKPLRDFGSPLADVIGPMPYAQVQRMLDEGFPSGMQNYWKSNFLKGLDDTAIEMIVGHVRNAPSPNSAVAIEQLGGAVRQVGTNDTAFNHRNARYNLLIVGIWPDPAAKDENVRWVRDFWDAMEPYSSGSVYVNYLGQEAEEGAERIKAAYGPEKYKKLVALKNKYDPTNLFRLNQNIKPTGV
jgi:FAD/FMN-containing dehydrogenase